jgi:hypothetical protein
MMGPWRRPSSHDKEVSLPSLPTAPRRLACGAAAVLLAALAVSAPAHASTALEQSEATSIHFTMQPEATSLNFTRPAAELSLNFARKAG